MSEYTHTCRNCGPKAAYLFTPAQLKLKTSICRKWAADENKLRYVKAAVRADHVLTFGKRSHEHA